MLAKEVSDRNAEARLKQWLEIKRLRTEAKNKLGDNNAKRKEEGVEIIGEISDLAKKDGLPVTVDADTREKLKRDDAKESVFDVKVIEEKGGASQIGQGVTTDRYEPEKKMKLPDERPKKVKEIASPDSRKGEGEKGGSGRRNNTIAKWNRARLAKKQRKKECENRRRLLEQAKRLKKVKAKSRKEEKAKVSTEIDVEFITGAPVVGAETLDKEGELPIAKVNQALPNKMAKAGGAVYSTDSSITTALEDTPISEPKAKEKEALTSEAETNKTLIENSNEDIAKTSENATQPGILFSLFEQEEDLDLSFLSSWSNDAWFDETSESSIYNTTEGVLVHPSSERR